MTSFWKFFQTLFPASLLKNPHLTKYIKDNCDPGFASPRIQNLYPKILSSLHFEKLFENAFFRLHFFKKTRIFFRSQVLMYRNRVQIIRELTKRVPTAREKKSFAVLSAKLEIGLHKVQLSFLNFTSFLGSPESILYPVSKPNMFDYDILLASFTLKP